MTGLLNSQNLLPKKTLFNGKNAVIISEPQMDSISYKYINYKILFSKYNAFQLKFEALSLKYDRSLDEISFLKSDNANLSLYNTKLEERLQIKDKIYETDKLLWKEKAKGKFNAFLTGTAIGALIVAIISLL